MVREEELVQKAKEVREALIEMAAREIDATHIEVGQIKAKDDTRKLLTVRVGGANRYVPYQGHDTSEFTVGDYWAIIFDDYGTIRLGWWVSNNAGGGTIPSGPHASSHEDGGADEISVAALSGLLADDQHVLDAEVLAVAAALVHKARHVSGGADAFANTDLLEAIIKRIEVTGPVTLTMGAVADGEFLKRVGAAIVGAAAAGANHNILDANVHPDSVIQAVTRGSIIVGNPTPKWDELPIGAAGRVLTVVAGDVAWAVPTGALDSATYWGRNLAKNSPGQIVTDGVEPQWWEDTTDATITDEDTVGEGIADIHERCFKVVTTANNEEGYQVLTFADEKLLDAGQTVVSFGCWVYCAAANKASIAIMGVNLGLQESAQHTGSASWEWLEIENITLNAADASISLYLRVDTGTAYFTMPMLSVGPGTQPWKPRGTEFFPRELVWQLDLNTTGDVNWSDTDCTGNTDNLALGIQMTVWVTEPDGIAGSRAFLGHHDDLVGVDGEVVAATIFVPGVATWASSARVACNDSQVVRYEVRESDADADMRVIFIINGYWAWE